VAFKKMYAKFAEKLFYDDVINKGAQKKDTRRNGYMYGYLRDKYLQAYNY